MPTTGVAGGALSGAASGAATGAAFGPWGAAIGGVIGAIGGGLSASGTSSAQSAANKQAALAAAGQNAQAWQNYLSGRGINIQQLVSQFPDIQGGYQAAVARGDKRDFNTWLYQALAAQPNHPIWDAIANPQGSAQQNTTLPAWATIDGVAAQPELFRQLIAQSYLGQNNFATVANARAFLESNPNALAEITNQPGFLESGTDPAQWLVDHVTRTEAGEGGGRFTTALQSFASQQQRTNNPTLDPAIAALLPRSTETLGQLFDGTLLTQAQAALTPVQNARMDGANLVQTRIDEQRARSGDILSAELGGLDALRSARTTGAEGIYSATRAGAEGVNAATITNLANILGVRRDVAEQIFEATNLGATGVRDARRTGAEGIYGAELLQADTIDQSARQALGRLLGEQSAERARRGFTGGGSGSDIVRARLMSDYLQKGAGARAGAGVNRATRFSDADTGFAVDTGRAGVDRATSIGGARDADALGRLQAAVELARSLGGAGVTRATSLGVVGEADAAGRMTANVGNANRLAGLLNADAGIARANAAQTNASDALNLLIADQNRRTGSLSAPYQLAGASLSLDAARANQPFAGLDAILQRLQGFSANPASGPGLTTSNPGAVLNGTQIAGGALSSLGSIFQTQSNGNALADLIASISRGRAPATGAGGGLGNNIPGGDDDLG